MTNRRPLHSHIRWNPPTRDTGTHTVYWKWYSDSKLVASRQRGLHFNKSPRQFYCAFPGTDFQPGHYHVDVSIGDAVVDAHDFDIVAE